MHCQRYALKQMFNYDYYYYYYKCNFYKQTNVVDLFCSFIFASSSVWNSIPNDVMCAPSLSSFKSRLKTYLFRSVYKD